MTKTGTLQPFKRFNTLTFIFFFTPLNVQVLTSAELTYSHVKMSTTIKKHDEQEMTYKF